MYCYFFNAISFNAFLNLNFWYVSNFMQLLLAKRLFYFKKLRYEKNPSITLPKFP